MAERDDRNGAAERYADGGKKRRTTIAAIAVLVVVAAVVGYVYLHSHKPSAASQYRTATASKRHLVATVSADGEVTPIHSTDIYAQVSGTVKRLYVKLGDHVEAGDKLYVVDTSSLHATTLQAKGTLATQKQSRKQASATLANAEQALAQAQASKLQAAQNLAALESKPATTTGLADQIELAKKQKKTAQAGVDAADASVRAAKAGVSAADVNVSSAQHSYDTALSNEANATVVAPVTGVITTMDLAVGGPVSGSGGSATQASVSAGTSTASIVISDDAAYKVRVDVSESQRPRVKLGQAAMVSFDALKSGDTSGTVTWIAPAATNSSGVITYEADISLESQPTGMAQGMSAAAKIVTDDLSDVLTVPTSAVKVDGATTYVVVLGSDGTTRAVPIQIGRTDNTNTQVLSGLRDGDKAVIGVNASAGTITLPTPAANGD